jgi:hypothetical protein
MMLITFEQTGQIPDKMHIFYEQAFDALFFLHDAAKEGVYKRKTYANLPIDEFRNCLSAFCIVSYAKEMFSFTQGELRAVTKQALEIEKKQVSIPDFVSDLVESTCLLQMEGTDLSFTHRSFQEYFAACFIARSPSISLVNLLDQLVRRREDDVLSMAFAMNRNLIEREWIIPKLHLFIQESSEIDPVKDPIGYVRKMFGQLSLEIRNGRPVDFIYSETLPQAFVWFAIMTLYRDEYFAPLHKWANRQIKTDASVISSALENLKRADDPRLAVVGSPSRRRLPRSIPIKPTDGSWVLQTRVPAYFSRHREIVQKMLKNIEKDENTQRDILNALLPSKAN